MSVWEELYKQHSASRRCERTWSTEVRKLLMKLASEGHCDDAVRGRFNVSKSGRKEEWSIRSGPESMLLDGMKLAELQVFASLTGDHMHAFSVIASGVREDDSKWLVAVHLHPDHKHQVGDKAEAGACSHAALHCHIGPDFESLPVTRVPLPAMGPADALTWVLSQLVPGKLFEPTPWESIKPELAGRR